MLQKYAKQQDNKIPQSMYLYTIYEVAKFNLTIKAGYLDFQFSLSASKGINS